MFIKFRNIFLLLFFCFAFVVSTTSVLAQEIGILNSPATESAKVDAGTIGVDYQLSYPGLLPDHPLYFLKTARERVMSFFISNPLKKAEFDLLQADKRVRSSEMLVAKGKINLAQSTFSKGENYFGESLNDIKQAKSQGMRINEFAQKLKYANLKHKETLSDIIDSLSRKEKNLFTTEANRLDNFSQNVKDLNPNK